MAWPVQPGKVVHLKRWTIFFQNFSGRTEPIRWVLDRNFQKFWLNGLCLIIFFRGQESITLHSITPSFPLCVFFVTTQSHRHSKKSFSLHCKKMKQKCTKTKNARLRVVDSLYHRCSCLLNYQNLNSRRDIQT